MNADLNLDVSADEARALHRVVRAMHDGHCPNCGIIRPAEEMAHPQAGWCCIDCGFRISREEADAALKAFQPYLQKSVRIFKAWREGITEQDIAEAAPDFSIHNP